MSRRPVVDAWADKHGFRPAVPFQDRNSHLGGKPGARHSGFYLLIFSNDEYYVGESVDIRSRMGGHNASWGPEIAEVRFLRKPLSKQKLRSIERGLIRELNGKIPQGCRNKSHTYFSASSDELIDLLDDAEQAAWLADRSGFNRIDATPLKSIPPEQTVMYRTAAQRFNAHPMNVLAVETLRLYLESCIPAPRRTEFHGWNVSSGTYNGRRLLCVSVGKMESFVVGSGGEGFINLSPHGLSQRDIRRIARIHADVSQIRTVHYDDFGEVLHVQAETLDGLQALLRDDSVARAAGDLAYNVMRKHPSVYSRYHCPQVVEAAYSKEWTRPDEDDGDDATADLVVVAEASIHPGHLDTEIETTQSAGLAGAAAHEPDAVPDGIAIDWFVTPGPLKSGRNQPDDFLAAGEWRMDPSPKYEQKVQEIWAGERIAVCRRRNVTDGVPFDRRDHPVSAMEILMTGIVTENPGDGVSVRVQWSPPAPPRRWFMYTSQDTVWPVVGEINGYQRQLSEFTFDGAKQDTDFWRNEPFWRERYGDQPATQHRGRRHDDLPH